MTSIKKILILDKQDHYVIIVLDHFIATQGNDFKQLASRLWAILTTYKNLGKLNDDLKPAPPEYYDMFELATKMDWMYRTEFWKDAEIRILKRND